MSKSSTVTRARHTRPHSPLEALVCLTTILAALPCIAGLTIDIVSDAPDRAEASLTDPVSGDWRTRSTAAMAWPYDVRCEDGSAPPIRNGAFHVAPDCGVLRWRFGVQPYPANGDMASSQQAWSQDAAWWLITEGSGILRNAGHPAPRVQFRLDGGVLTPLAGPSHLPGLHQAPGFWLLGQATHVNKGGMHHFFDSTAPPAHLDGLLDSHAAAIGFLSEALPGRAPSPVFWLRIADWQAGMGGASGTGLVLANYPAYAGALDPVAEAITLYLVLHEHGHQFFESSGVLWIDESLASYLAAIAIREAAPQHYPVIADAFVRPGRDLGTSLPLLGERAAAGNETAYGQLYSGAALWLALDEAMAEGGSLLPRLADLLASLGAQGEPLNEATVAVHTGISEGSVAAILASYIFDAPPQ